MRGDVDRVGVCVAVVFPAPFSLVVGVALRDVGAIGRVARRLLAVLRAAVAEAALVNRGLGGIGVDGGRRRDRKSHRARCR